MRGLLGAQGFQVFQPHRVEAVVADVSVEPIPGSPEWLLFREVPRRVSYRVEERDPWRALSLALIAPRRGFDEVSVGVDPGGLCAVSVVADGLLLRAWKTPCSLVGESLAGFLESLPASRVGVYIGSGPGVLEAASSLGEAGMPYSIMDESWTTSRPALWGVLRLLSDRDLTASATIALSASRRHGATL